MKTQIKLAALALLLSTLNPQFSTLFAQGSLTPPGAPAPTMMSLDQIEPRTPISSAPFTISQPGSYYLTTSLAVSSGDAVTIAVSGVTLDLNGFTISSSEPSPVGTGILLNGGLSDITILNGHIRGGVTNNGSGVYSGTGFAHGIYDWDSSSVNVLISRVSVSGCLYYGIYLNPLDSTVVENCTARTAGSSGIIASTIKTASAKDCGNAAIYGDQVSDCRGQSTGDYGVYANTALNCYGQGNFYGVYASTALNCSGSSSTGTAVFAATAQNCYGISYGSGYGVYAPKIAIGCYGVSITGAGLNAFIANVCSGSSISATHNVNSY